MQQPSTFIAQPEGMERIDLPSGPVHYRVGGNGFPCLLIHGWGGSSRYWQGTIASLGDRHRFYAPDMPGYGASPPMQDVATPQRLAELLIAYADSLGLEQFDLNGHSFSAGVACFMAARYPERVRRLVLTCFSTYRSERERRVVNQVHHILALWMALRRPWMAQQRAIYRTAAGRFFYRPPSDDAILQESFADFLKMDKRVALESAANAGSLEINEALRAVQCPTLLIGGRQDAIMPPQGTPEVARLIPNCKLIWIERCGHLPMIERPEVYHRLVGEFLRD
jgi:pimeloyl-ACP methyl ester carboxylesterase